VGWNFENIWGGCTLDDCIRSLRHLNYWCLYSNEPTVGDAAYMWLKEIMNDNFYGE
jgi:hypothetical protein